MITSLRPVACAARKASVCQDLYAHAKSQLDQSGFDQHRPWAYWPSVRNGPGARMTKSASMASTVETYGYGLLSFGQEGCCPCRGLHASVELTRLWRVPSVAELIIAIIVKKFLVLFSRILTASRPCFLLKVCKTIILNRVITLSSQVMMNWQKALCVPEPKVFSLPIFLRKNLL